jgi:hypothetical protein
MWIRYIFVVEVVRYDDEENTCALPQGPPLRPPQGGFLKPPALRVVDYWKLKMVIDLLGKQRRIAGYEIVWLCCIDEFHLKAICGYA